MDQMTTMIAEHARGETLDIAAGRGEFIKYLLESAPNIEHVIGIDISEDNLNKAREVLDHGRAEFRIMPGEKLDFEDESFDTVSLSLSLHHVDSPEAVIGEAWRVLRPGGSFVLFEMFSNDQSEKQMTHVLLHHWWADVDREMGTPHNHTFTDKQILAYVHKFPWHSVKTVLAEEDGDRFDETKTIADLKSICDMYYGKIAKISNSERANFLKTTGDSLRKRLDTIGVNWCRAICVLALKP